jgi:rod shape-determining protein MreC
MLAGLISLFTPQSITSKFQFAFARIFSRPLSISRSVSLSARTQHHLTDLVSRRQYNKLQNYLANVTQELHQERRKLEKLSQLHNRFVWEGTHFVLADVITAFIDGLHNELIINRGQIDGLNKGQFVLADNSIIGTISDVSSRIARVKLITDSTSNIAVKIAGLNAGRLMRGSGYNSATISLVKHKVKTGESIYADRKPGFLDAPMIVGKVSQCKRSIAIPLLWDITVEPACDMETLDSIAVIIMNPRE